MIQLHFGIKQLVEEGKLWVFTFIYVKYGNVEGFCRDSHKLFKKCIKEYLQINRCTLIEQPLPKYLASIVVLGVYIDIIHQYTPTKHTYACTVI